MRILQVHNYYKNYGGECYVVDSEKKLLEANGHEVKQYTRRSTDIESWGLLKKSISLVSIPFNLIEYNSILKYINLTRPDVAHVHNVFPLISPSAYAALFRMSIPTVQTVHNYRFMCPNGMFFIQEKICEDCQNRGYYSAITKRCVRGSYLVSALYSAAVAIAWRSKVFPDNITRYIALNRFVSDKLVTAGIPRNKIAICGNYINIETKQVTNKQRYILFLGRLSIEKGVMTLLKAVCSLDNVILKVAGTGPEEQNLKRYASKYLNDRVEFLGFVERDDKKRLLSEAICSVVPSEWYENFPISVLESLSLGTPVIASRIGGLPDMVAHGTTGLLFEAGDIQELAGCIKSLWDKEGIVKDMSTQATIIAETRFNSVSHLKGLIDIYEDAITESGATRK